MNEQSELVNICNDLKKDLKNISEKVVELTVLNKGYEKTNQSNTEKIDAIEADMQFAKGSIALFKGVGLTLIGFALSITVTFGTWIVTTYYNTQAKLSQIELSIAVINSEMKQLNRDQNNERTESGNH